MHHRVAPNDDLVQLQRANTGADGHCRRAAYDTPHSRTQRYNIFRRIRGRLFLFRAALGILVS